MHSDLHTPDTRIAHEYLRLAAAHFFHYCLPVCFLLPEVWTALTLQIPACKTHISREKSPISLLFFFVFSPSHSFLHKFPAILFQPSFLLPVIWKNCFYLLPECVGMIHFFSMAKLMNNHIIQHFRWCQYQKPVEIQVS